jgi:hypothetical protein
MQGHPYSRRVDNQQSQPQYPCGHYDEEQALPLAAQALSIEDAIYFFALRLTLYAIATACLTDFFGLLPFFSNAFTSVETFFENAFLDFDLSSGIISSPKASLSSRLVLSSLPLGLSPSRPSSSFS